MPVQLRPRPSSKTDSIVLQVKKYLFKKNKNLIEYLIKNLLTTTLVPPEQWATTFKTECNDYFVRYLASAIVTYLHHHQASKDSSTVNGVRALKILEPESANLVVKRLLKVVNDWTWVGDPQSELAVTTSERLGAKLPKHSSNKQTPEIMLATIARHIKDVHRGSLKEWLHSLGLIDPSTGQVDEKIYELQDVFGLCEQGGIVGANTKDVANLYTYIQTMHTDAGDIDELTDKMALTTSQIVRVINRYQRFLDTTVVIGSLGGNSIELVDKIWEKVEEDPNATKGSPSGLGFDTKVSTSFLKNVLVSEFGCHDTNIDALLEDIADIMCWKSLESESNNSIFLSKVELLHAFRVLQICTGNGIGNASENHRGEARRIYTERVIATDVLKRIIMSINKNPIYGSNEDGLVDKTAIKRWMADLNLMDPSAETPRGDMILSQGTLNAIGANLSIDEQIVLLKYVAETSMKGDGRATPLAFYESLERIVAAQSIETVLDNLGDPDVFVKTVWGTDGIHHEKDADELIKDLKRCGISKPKFFLETLAEIQNWSLNKDPAAVGGNGGSGLISQAKFKEGISVGRSLTTEKEVGRSAKLRPNTVLIMAYAVYNIEHVYGGDLRRWAIAMNLIDADSNSVIDKNEDAEEPLDSSTPAKKIPYHTFEAILHRCEITCSTHELRYCYNDIDHIEHGITTNNLLKLLNNIVLCRDGREALDKIHERGYVDYVVNMDLGKFASGKLSRDDILDQLLMDGVLESDEIEKVGKMLDAMATRDSIILSNKVGEKQSKNNDLPDGIGFENDSDVGDDEVSKRKFSPAELAEFFNACIILSRPELPGEQLDIMAASDTLSKIIRGIDLEHNGSIIAMLQSIKLADAQGNIINAPLNIRLLKKVLRTTGVNTASRQDIGKLLHGIEVLSRADKATIHGLYDAIKMKIEVNDIHDTLEFSIGHSSHFVEDCKLDPAGVEPTAENLQQLFVRAGLGIPEALKLSSVVMKEINFGNQNDALQGINAGSNRIVTSKLTQETLEGILERLRHLAGAVPGSHASDASYVEMSSLRLLARINDIIDRNYGSDEISFFKEFKLIEDRENIEDNSVALQDLVVIASSLGLETSRNELLHLLQYISEQNPHSNIEAFINHLKRVSILKTLRGFMHNAIDDGNSFAARVFNGSNCIVMTTADVISKMVSLGFDSTKSLEFFRAIKNVYGLPFEAAISQEWLSEMVDVALIASGEKHNIETQREAHTGFLIAHLLDHIDDKYSGKWDKWLGKYGLIDNNGISTDRVVNVSLMKEMCKDAGINASDPFLEDIVDLIAAERLGSRDSDLDKDDVGIKISSAQAYLNLIETVSRAKLQHEIIPSDILGFVDSLGIESHVYRIPKEELLYMFIDSGMEENRAKGLVDSLWHDLKLDGFDGLTRGHLINGLQMYANLGDEKSWDSHARSNVYTGYSAHEAPTNGSADILFTSLKALEKIIETDETEDMVPKVGGVTSILGAMGTAAGLDETALPASARKDIVEACENMIDSYNFKNSTALPVQLAEDAVKRLNNATRPNQAKEFASSPKKQAEAIADLKTLLVYASCESTCVQCVRIGALEAAMQACKCIVSLPPTCHDRERLHQVCSITVAEIVKVMEQHMLDETMDVESHHIDLDVLDHALVEIDRLGSSFSQVPSDAKTLLAHLRVMSTCLISSSATKLLTKKGALNVMIQALSIACSADIAPLTSLKLSEKEEIIKAAAIALRGFIKCSLRVGTTEPEFAKNVLNEVIENGVVACVLKGLGSNAKYDIGELLQLLAILAEEEPLQQNILKQRGIRIVIRVLQLHKNDPDVVLAATNVLRILSQTNEGANAVSQSGGTRNVIKFAMECPAEARFIPAAAGAAELLATLVVASKSVDGLRESLVEQEISSAAVQLVDKFPEEENVTRYADKVLSEVMSPQSAVYLMANPELSDIVHDYMPGAQSMAAEVIGANMAKICSTEGGSQAMQSIVTGMANSGKQSELNGFVANVMTTLECNSEHAQTCLEVLNKVTEHVHSSALVSEELINMRVGSRISAALANSSKNDENDNFARDALSLLQGMETDEIDNDDDVVDIGALKAALKKVEKKIKRPDFTTQKKNIKDESSAIVEQRLQELKDVDPGNIKQYIKKMSEIADVTKKRHNQRLYASKGAGVAATQLILKYIAYIDLLIPCLQTLINLAFRAPDICHHLVEQLKLPSVLEFVAHKHTESLKINNLLYLLLCNLCAGDVQRQSWIWTKLGQKLMYIAHKHRESSDIAASSTRLFGILCDSDEIMTSMVCDGVTSILVHFIEIHPKEHEVLKLCMDVLGNFFLAEFEEEYDLSNYHEQLYSYRAAEVVLETISNSVPSKVLSAGLEALYNATVYPPSLERLVVKDLVETILKIIQIHDYDEVVIQHAMSMVHAITVSATCRTILLEDGGFQVIVGVIENSILEKERIGVLENTVSAFYHLSTDEEIRKRMVALGGIAAVANLIGLSTGDGYDRECILITISALTKLAADDNCMFDVARFAIPALMKICNDLYPKEYAFLSGLIGIIGLLSFNEEALRLAVIHGGITFVINNLCAWPNHPNMCIRCVSTLENIAMASTGHAEIIINEGGLLAIESTQKSFEANSQNPNSALIVETCANAMLSMGAMKLEINAEKFRRRNMKARRVMSFSNNPTFQEYNM